MTLHTLFLLDTSLSMAPIFQSLVDYVLCPLANTLQKGRKAGCTFRFSLFCTPENHLMLQGGDADHLETVLNQLTLGGGDPDGNESITSALQAILPQDTSAPTEDCRYSLCIISDTLAFADAVGNELSFDAPDNLLSVIFLHHPNCTTSLIARSRALDSVEVSMYPLNNELPGKVSNIALKISDTVLLNSNLF